MIRYRPAYLTIAIFLFIFGGSLYVSFLTALIAWEGFGTPRFLLISLSCLFGVIAYVQAVPLFTWPCGIKIDRGHDRITFCYLLFRRRLSIGQIQECLTSEAMNRYPYVTYVLTLKGGGTILLSAMTIAHFPGPFAYNIRRDVSGSLPRFIPGFRWLFHRPK